MLPRQRKSAYSPAISPAPIKRESQPASSCAQKPSLVKTATRRAFFGSPPINLLKSRSEKMTVSYQDIGKAMNVDFAKIFLDPNNPRIAPDSGGRYRDPDAIFDGELQRTLTQRFYDVYHA